MLMTALFSASSFPKKAIEDCLDALKDGTVDSIITGSNELERLIGKEPRYSNINYCELPNPVTYTFAALKEQDSEWQSSSVLSR